MNDLKKEFHDKIESLTNGTSDSHSTNETSSTAGVRSTTSTSQGQVPNRRPLPVEDPLIDPLAAGRRTHPYAGGWGQLPGCYGPGAAGGYGTSDLDPFGRTTRGGGMSMDPTLFQPSMRYSLFLFLL